MDIGSELVKSCNSARGRGLDFPTIWQTILRPHRHVAGLPIQDRGDRVPVLKIPMITGRFVIADASGFRLD
jgi:hypothetical protein